MSCDGLRPPRPAAARRPAPRRRSGVPAWCGRRRARSRRCPAGRGRCTRTRSPCRASAAARLTVVVVLPTPPFWLATVMTRVRPGRGRSPARPALTCDGGARPRQRSGWRSRRSRARFHVKHPVDAAVCSLIGRPRPAPAGPDRSGSPDHPDDGRGRVDHAHAAGEHLRAASAGQLPARAVAASSSVGRGLALQGQQAAARAQQRQTTSRPAGRAGPPREPSRRRRRDLPGRAACACSSARARTTRTLVSPSSSTTSRRKVVRRSSGSTRVTSRSGRTSAEHHTGQPGPAADVVHTGARLGMSSLEHRAVQQVPVPQPRHLARARSDPARPRRRPAARRSAASASRRGPE